MADTIRVQLVRSSSGHPKSHRDTLQGLGLTKLNKIVTLKDTPVSRGMVNKVCHLVRVIED